MKLTFFNKIDENDLKHFFTILQKNSALEDLYSTLSDSNEIVDLFSEINIEDVKKKLNNFKKDIKIEKEEIRKKYGWTKETFKKLQFRSSGNIYIVE